MTGESQIPDIDGFIPTKTMRIGKAVLFIILGLAALMVGGRWMVGGAVFLSRMIGISESVIGLTIVAIGTSLPELATSLTAARKGNADIAIGNVVGSNIFNIFFILGISALITPLPFSAVSNLDIGVVVLSSLLLFLFMFTGRKQRLDRWEGALFLLIYTIYLVVLVVLER